MLGEFDNSFLDNNEEITVRLTVFDNRGNKQVHYTLYIVDKDLKPGWPVQITTQFGYYSGAMAAVDFEKDGDMEIAVITRVNHAVRLSVYEHNGIKKLDRWGKSLHWVAPWYGQPTIGLATYCLFQTKKAKVTMTAQQHLCSTSG